MDIIEVPKGSEVFVGAPANPLPLSITDEITRKINFIGGIREAHLPQCYVQGITERPAQILVVVSDVVDLGKVLEEVGIVLNEALSCAVSMDIWPLEKSNELLALVREAKCQIK